MKRIGLVGGMSWQSTAMYYKYINEYIKNKKGGLASANILLSSINFSEIEGLQKNGKWNEAEKIIRQEIERLENAGADFVGVCSNTGNECISRLKEKMNIILVHIADPIGKFIVKNKMKKVGLIGTIYTMENGYIKDILDKKYKAEVFIPDKTDRIVINDIIYKELCRGTVKESSRKKYLFIMKKMIKRNKLNGFILGCTEISMLINKKDINIKLVDSTKLHAEYLAQKSLQ